MQVVILKHPLYGSVYWNGSDFVYTSFGTNNSSDSFIYSITQNNKTIIYTKYVNLDNQAPTTNSIQLTANVNTTITVKLSDIASDNTIFFDNLKIKSVTGNKNGNLYNTDTEIYYESEKYNDIEVLTYTVTDKEYETTNTITITLSNGYSRDIPSKGIRRFLPLENNITQFSKNTAGYTSMYPILSQFQNSWDSIDYDLYNRMSDVVDNSNLSWSSVYRNKEKYQNLSNVLCANSAKWNSDVPIVSSIYDLITPSIISWNSDYNILVTTSSNWNNAITTNKLLSSSLSAIEQKINNTQNNINNNVNSIWNTTEIFAITSKYFPFWTTGYSILTTYNNIWNDQITKSISLSTSYYRNKNKFDNTTQTVIDNYLTKWDLTNLLSLSADYFNKWNELNTLLYSNSSIWNGYITSLITLSTSYYRNKNKFDNTTQTVIDNYLTKWDLTNLLSLSANYFDKWINLNTLIKSYSSTWQNSLNDTINFINYYNTNKNNFDNTTQTVIDNYLTRWDLTELLSLSANYFHIWNELNTLITSNSSSWNTQTILLTSLSTSYYTNKNNFDNTTQTVIDNSSSTWSPFSLSNDFNKYSNTYNLVCSYSADWDHIAGSKVLFHIQFDKDDEQFDTLVDLVTSNNNINWGTSLSALSVNNYYKWNNSYNYINKNKDVLTYNDIVYTNIYIEFLNIQSNYNNTYTTVKDNSANYNSTGILEISSYSPKWNNTYDIIANKGLKWGSSLYLGNVFDKYIYSNYILNNNYLNWNNNSIYNNINSTSSRNNNLYNLLISESAKWSIGKDQVLYNNIISNSNKFNNVYNTVSSNTNNNNWGILSGYINDNYNLYWDSVFNFVYISEKINVYTLTYNNTNTFKNIFNQKNITFNNTTNTINSNISYWDTAVNTYNTILNYIPKWDSYVNSLSTLSSIWSNNSDKPDLFLTYTQQNSAKFNNLNTNFVVISTNLYNTNELINLSSNAFLKGNSTTDLSAKSIISKGNLTINNNLSVFGVINNINTEILTTSSFIVTNLSTNDAFVVTKLGIAGGISTFKNPNSATVLDINANQTVGINTPIANKTLTVVGSISTSGKIYNYLNDITTTFSINSGKYYSTYNTVTSLSTDINLFNIDKNKYDTSNTYVSNSSSIINNLLLINYVSYENMYNISLSQSSINEITTNLISLSTNNFAKDLIFRSNQNKYDTTYSIITSITSTEVFEIYNSFNSNSVLTPKTIYYVVPSNLRIKEWTIIADKQTTASIDILSSDFNKFNITNPATQTLISISNKPTLNNELKKTYSLLSGNWYTDLVSESILIFNLTQNTDANSISINLKVTKI
jgi:hypothetical protein